MAKGGKKNPGRTRIITALRHEEAKRKNIPTAEMQSIAERAEEMRPRAPVHFPRATPLPKGESRPRNADLDPQLIWNGARIRLTKEQFRALEEKGEIEIGSAQLVWRGKDNQDWSDLVVQAPPLYIQEKLHPKVIIDDLVRRTKVKVQETTDAPDLFADFNGLDPEARIEFYQHDQHWSNRMILGDSLQVMASLVEREGLRGKVQCIYIDPPYGIKFNSNWQVSTLSRDVKDGKREDISREPEQVKAFRDTWRDGIHSYLTYLRDRLSVARELLNESGSIFVQIGDANVHLVRAVVDEVFSADQFIALIGYNTTSSQTSRILANPKDYILWYAKDIQSVKFRQIYSSKRLYIDGKSQWSHVEENYSRRPLTIGEATALDRLPAALRVFRLGDATSQRQGRPSGESSAMGFPYNLFGSEYRPAGTRGWSTTHEGMARLGRADRLTPVGKNIRIVRYFEDFPVTPITSSWDDTGIAGFASEKVYVVQTNEKVVERCLSMSTDPGDLVLDPTCGSGTTAYVAELWGRRWITIDTSRVALALARARIMGARYSYYILSDSPEGHAKEQEVTGKVQPSADAWRHPPGLRL